MSLPILAITMGDPAGIGPEIVAEAFCTDVIYQQCRPVVTGDAAVMQKAINLLNLPLQVNVIEQVSEAKFEKGTMDVIDLKLIDIDQHEFGQVSAQCGDAAFQSVVKAIELAMNNEVDGTVTAPPNKDSLNPVGHHFSGHSQIYTHYTDT